jgi:putative FmdB family regulatory protein
VPTYEYACKECGEHLEVFQKFTDEPLTECPACSGPLRKVFGNIGISFKGSGFYKTDSRTSENGSKKKESEPVKADTSSGSSSDTKSTTKSETKSDGAKSDSAKSGKGNSTAAAS